MLCSVSQKLTDSHEIKTYEFIIEIKHVSLLNSLQKVPDNYL